MQMAPLRATMSSLPSALQLQELIWPWTGDVDAKVDAKPVQAVPLTPVWPSRKSSDLLPGVLKTSWPFAVLLERDAMPAERMTSLDIVPVLAWRRNYVVERVVDRNPKVSPDTQWHKVRVYTSVAYLCCLRVTHWLAQLPS